MDHKELYIVWQMRVTYDRHEASYKQLVLHFYKELTGFAFSFMKNEEMAKLVFFVDIHLFSVCVFGR